MSPEKPESAENRNPQKQLHDESLLRAVEMERLK
jgi:hypothetical protein